jgi:hypothetical protein
MRKTITLLLVGISIVAEAQINRDLLLCKNKEVLSKYLNSETTSLKSAVNPNVFKPDSSIYYADTVGDERYALMTNLFQGDSVVITSYWYDSDTINYKKKNTHYMDETLPQLPFEPIFGGGRNGYANSYSYIFTSTIGDTLSKSYIFDFEKETWSLESKTKHYISQEGIDTLAITHIWDLDSKNWILNNTTKQEYIDSEVDTLKVLMLAPNQADTINYDIITYKYNESGQVVFQRDTSYVWSYDIDSTVYDEDGLIDFIYHGGNGQGYVYAEEHFYDSKSRLDKIYFWDKQGLPEWTFAGYFKFYYPQDITSIEHIENNNEYKIYPNPFNSQLTIESYEGGIEIYNSNGQLIKSEHLENGGFINTSSLCSGLFIIKLENGYSKLITKQ